MVLADILKSAPRTVYASVDGALLENAPAQLDDLEFERWPLYRGRLENVGIQLVALQGEADIDRFLTLCGESMPAVFWSWPGTDEEIFRHLRGIGKVEVPKPGTNPDDPEFDQVVFRHADPNSLIRVLRILTEEQRLKFLGDARGLILEHVDLSGRREIVRMPRDGRLLAGAPTLVPA